MVRPKYCGPASGVKPWADRPLSEGDAGMGASRRRAGSRGGGRASSAGQAQLHPRVRASMSAGSLGGTASSSLHNPGNPRNGIPAPKRYLNSYVPPLAAANERSSFSGECRRLSAHPAGPFCLRR